MRPPTMLAAWHASGRRMDFRGRRIFFREQGAGEVVLCLHGYPTSSWDWHRLWPALTESRRALAPDFLGFGYSDKPADHDYSLFEQADLVEALCRHRGVERVHLLAHDMGDTVAQELLARDLEGTGRLELISATLLNGGIYYEAIDQRPIQRFLQVPALGALVGRLANRWLFGRQLAAVFGPARPPTSEELDGFWFLLSREGGHRIQHRIIRYLDERCRHRARWGQALAETPVPVRLVYGPADPVNGERTAAVFRREVPEADIVRLGDGVGHYPQIEAPEAVWTAFEENLAQARERRESS